MFPLNFKTSKSLATVIRTSDEFVWATIFIVVVPSVESRENKTYPMLSKVYILRESNAKQIPESLW